MAKKKPKHPRQPVVKLACMDFSKDDWQHFAQRLTKEQLDVARAYDPNCDYYVYADEVEKMQAARQTVEAMQELATFLGRDPEGCLVDTPDEAMGRIEELEAERERQESELASLRAERERLRGVLQELLDSDCPMPPFEDGTEAQKAWGLRIYVAQEAARAALAGDGEGKGAT